MGKKVPEVGKKEARSGGKDARSGENSGEISGEFPTPSSRIGVGRFPVYVSLDSVRVSSTFIGFRKAFEHSGSHPGTLNGAKPEQDHETSSEFWKFLMEFLGS